MSYEGQELIHYKDPMGLIVFQKLFQTHGQEVPSLPSTL